MEEIIKEICKFIISNLNDDFSMEQIEKEFCYNKYYLIRLFKAYTGYTIREFANTVKVLKSTDPLLFTDDTILKIALNNGFNSQEYYSEKFQDVIGVSPMKFRKEYQEIDMISDKKELELKKEYLLYLDYCKKQLLNIAYQSEKIDKFEKVKRLKK